MAMKFRICFRETLLKEAAINDQKIAECSGYERDRPALIEPCPGGGPHHHLDPFGS